MIADSNFFRFRTKNYFSYLLLQRYHATEMILRVTLIKHCKQSLDSFLENNGRINMLFALIAFLNLWLKNLKNACEAAHPWDPQMQLLGFLIKQICKLWVKSFKSLNFKFYPFYISSSTFIFSTSFPGYISKGRWGESTFSTIFYIEKEKCPEQVVV